MVSQRRDEEWAVDLFRPLIQKLRLQESAQSPVLVKVSDFRNLVIKGMGRCLIFLQQRPLADHNPPSKGYFVFVHHKEENLYILSIVIDSNLYRDESLESKVARKAVGVHEFCHCVAAMLSLAEVSSGSSVFEKLQDRLREKVTKTSSSDFINLMAAFSNLGKNSDYLSQSFPDSHFRLGFEDFTGDYSELYINFLLPYSLVKETVRDERLAGLKASLHNQENLVQLLIQLIDDLSRQKALDKRFVVNRLQALLPRLLLESR